MALLAAAVLLLTACGERPAGAGDGRGGDGDGSAGSAGSAGPAADEEMVVRGTVEVIDDGQGAPRLCDAVMESHPPQCHGWEIVGLDWARLPADSYATAAGVAWGRFELTGAWDGERLTLTAPPVPDGRFGHRPEPAGEEPGTGCPESEDWYVDGDRCRRSPGLSHDELLTVQEALGEEFAAEVAGSWVDEATGTVRATVVVVTDRLAGAVEERFGAGAVVLHGLLTPVEG